MNISPVSLNGIGPLSADPKKALRTAANALESIWLSRVMKNSHVNFSSSTKKTFAEKTFQEMFDEVIGQSMASSGFLGLGDEMVRQLLPEENAAAAVSASGVKGAVKG